jgi:hypothetical protein
LDAHSPRRQAFSRTGCLGVNKHTVTAIYSWNSDGKLQVLLTAFRRQARRRSRQHIIIRIITLRRTYPLSVPVPACTPLRICVCAYARIPCVSPYLRACDAHSPRRQAFSRTGCLGVNKHTVTAIYSWNSDGKLQVLLTAFRRQARRRSRQHIIIRIITLRRTYPLSVPVPACTPLRICVCAYACISCVSPYLRACVPARCLRTACVPGRASVPACVRPLSAAFAPSRP